MQLWSSVIKNNLTFNQANSLILSGNCYAANVNHNCLYFYKNNALHILKDDSKLLTNISISNLNSINSNSWMIVKINAFAISLLKEFNLY